MRAIVTFLLVAALLAGCAGKGAEPPTPSPSSAGGGSISPAAIAPATPTGAAATASFATPAPWKVGDAWLVTSKNGDKSTQGALVVTEAAADAYTVQTTLQDVATYDAMFDVSYVGKIRASDLAGAQQGTAILYYSFPLADGKTWTTKWDGRDVSLTAKKSATGFDIIGTFNGSTYVKYDYSADTKWFSYLDFGAYGLKVDRVQSGWKGDLVTATTKKVFEAGADAPVLTKGSGSFTIDSGQTTGMVFLNGGGNSAWARGFQLVQPDGTPYMETTVDNPTFTSGANGATNYSATQVIPPTPGQWQIVAPVVHDPSGWGSITIFEVAIATKAFP